MTIKEVYCQDRAIGILQRASASDRAAHAYIFVGAEGVGKFKTAREWAKMLLCQDRVVDDGFADSCEACESCRQFEADAHPDFQHVYKELLEFTREGKGKPPPVELPIDVVREFLIEKVSNKPTLSESKVYVVSEAEKANIISQNAFLKVLEEPPVYCTIILLCTRLERLFPTIRSRCQIIRFGPVSQRIIVQELTRIGIQEEQARYWARLADGSIGQACQWAELQLAGAELYEKKKNLVESISACKYADALALAESLFSQSKQIAAAWAELQKGTSKSDVNRRAHKTLLQMAISALRDAMNLGLGRTDRLINSDQRQQIESLARRFRPEQAAEKISDCYRALTQIESNVNERLVFEQVLLNLAEYDTISAKGH
jgi:DNA polymerase-3 subunit delta'